MEILVIALLTLLASIVGTVTGFGISTIMVPLLALFFSPVVAIFLVTIIHWFGDLWKVILFRGGLDIKLALRFGIPGLLAGYGGALIALTVSPLLLLRILGVFLVAYACFLMFRPVFAVPVRIETAMLGGALSGFFAGVFGVGGAVRSAFLAVFNLPKEAYIATAGAIGILVDSTRFITYLHGGVLLPERLVWGLLVFIPVSFFGAYIAKHIVHRIPQEQFRTVVAMFLLLIGIKFIVWP